MKVIAMTTVLCLFAAPAMAQRVVKSVPPEGSLKPGQRVLVDDGTCPAGQIRQVVGGSFAPRLPRSDSCVARRK
jgi:hypothetical protein